jgi:hypothetical protein
MERARPLFSTIRALGNPVRFRASIMVELFLLPFLPCQMLWRAGDYRTSHRGNGGADR